MIDIKYGLIPGRKYRVAGKTIIAGKETVSIENGKAVVKSLAIKFYTGETFEIEDVTLSYIKNPEAEEFSRKGINILAKPIKITKALKEGTIPQRRRHQNR